MRAVHWIVESERRVWEIAGRNKPPVLVGEIVAEQTQSDQPSTRTSVNNCIRDRSVRAVLDLASIPLQLPMSDNDTTTDHLGVPPVDADFRIGE